MAKDITYEVVKDIGVISTSPSKWEKRLRYISWNGGAPKYDIRDWSPDGLKMGKGLTLTKEELLAVAALAGSLQDEPDDIPAT